MVRNIEKVKVISMSARNEIEIRIETGGQSLTYEEGLKALREHEVVKNLNLLDLYSINELIEKLDVTRAAFERNILQNESIGTGVRHIKIIGDKFSKTSIYIDALDLVDFLINYCGLKYWKKNEHTLTSLTKDQISKEDREYLAKTLSEGRLKTSKQLESECNRSRQVISRLIDIIETVTFAFPNSQRQLRRFVFSPKDSVEGIEHYFINYQSYVKNIIKVD